MMAVTVNMGGWCPKHHLMSTGPCRFCEKDNLHRAERAVIAAAVAWGTKYPVDPEGDASRALYEKVRALKEQRG